jgi:hypothetical protein
MADMHFMYGRAAGNASEARRLYAAAYPNRRLPSRQVFQRIHQRLRENGSFQPRVNDRGRDRFVRTPVMEENVLRAVQDNPRVSVRSVARMHNISFSVVWRILCEQLLHPFHIQRVQALNPNDYEPRRQFCQWFLRKSRRIPNFASLILFTDEASFSKDGYVNFHNAHEWADENPHSIFQSRHQIRFSVNVWAGILGDRLIGPFVLPNRLNGEDYYNFLVNDLPGLLEDVPLIERQSIWFMQDGAPPHYLHNVRQHLNELYGEKWIGRGGPVPWPPRSPDLNPLVYFLWGQLKAKVYKIPIETIQQLREEIETACMEIRQTPRIFQRVRKSLKRRARLCIEMQGGHFEQFL